MGTTIEIHLIFLHLIKTSPAGIISVGEFIVGIYNFEVKYMLSREKNNILRANLLLLLLGYLLFYLGSRVQSREIYSGLLITEYIIILIPNLIYLKSIGVSLKKTLRLNKINMKQIFYIILITVFSYPIAIFLNNLMLVLLSFFGEMVSNQVPIPNTKELYLLSIIVIAISPGICEEVMFRGTMMNAYESLGKRKAIIFSAVLFGLFHLNLQNLAGPIFLGIIFGIVVYKTNSIYSSIIGHALNNGIAMTIGYFVMKGQNGLEDVAAYEIPYKTQLLIALIATGVFALGASFILVRLLRRLPRAEQAITDDVTYVNANFIDFIPLIIGIILFFLVNIKYLFL